MNTTGYVDPILALQARARLAGLGVVIAPAPLRLGSVYRLCSEFLQKRKR